jgi:DNA-binding GntR family transcriptional regulator
MELPGLDDFAVSQLRTTEQIADALHQAIVSGALAPGARIRESAVAAQIGVSRNTVREAVLMLQQTGLVAHEVNRGMVVRALNVEAVADLYRVRELLELAAIDSVDATTDLRPVQRALQTFDRAAHRGVVEETVRHDLGFHGAIVSLLASPRLDQYFDALRSELRYYLATLSVAINESDTPDELVEQHAVVWRALSAGDTAEAHQLLQAHIRLNAGQVTALLTERGGK